MNTVSVWILRLASLGLVYACSLSRDETRPSASTIQFLEIRGSGDVTAKLTEFREGLIDYLNTAPEQTMGWREIDWGAVPASQTNTDSFRGDFFNSIDPTESAGRKRGAVFTTVGRGLRVSDRGFSDRLAASTDPFNAFHAGRTFAPIGSNTLDVTFSVPGQAIPASVKGFGAIFSDVDHDNSTTLEFFEGEKCLGTFTVPTRTDARGFSFLGVIFPQNNVTRVRITAGSAPISAQYTDGPEVDLVALNNLYYDEPEAY